VLLQFLKAEQSFYTDPTITPFPIKNMCIYSEMINYTYGFGCMKKLDEYWDSDSFDDIDTIGYYGLDSTPFYFTIKSKSSLNVLSGIVYLQSEYISHRWYIQTDDLDKYPGSTYNKPCREEFHIVRISDVDHVIVFLTPFRKNDMVKPRCNLECIFHDENQNSDNLEPLHTLFNERFCNILPKKVGCLILRNRAKNACN
jgi:hypothetical protein